MKRRETAIAAVALLVMALGLGVLVRLSATRQLGEPGIRVRVVDPAKQKVEILLPERVLNYVSTNLPPTEAELAVLPEDTTIAKRLYQAPDGFQIAVNVVLMGSDRTSIHKPEYCLTSQGWQILHRETVKVPVKRPHAYELPVRLFTASIVREVAGGRTVRHGGVYLFWFVADGRIAAGHFERLAKMTLDLFRTGRLPRWAYISCFAQCDPGEEPDTAERVKRFIAALAPAFQRVTLPEKGPGAVRAAGGIGD